MQVRNELRALTGLRGVAALYVTVFHYLIGLSMSNPGTTLIAHGYLAVDLFFVLSGFVMALNYGRMFRSTWSLQSYCKFLGRRIARIYPLYLTMTVLACVMMALGVLETPWTIAAPVTFTYNLLMIQAWGLTGSLDGPAWSISAEWAAYLLFPLILVPCLFRRPWVACLTGLGSIAVLAVLSMLPSSWGHRPSMDTVLDFHDSVMALPVLRCFPEFALGVITFRFSSTALGLRLARNRWVASVAVAATIMLLTVPRADLCVVLLFPLVVLCLTSERHAPGRVLSSGPAEFIGLLSYSIYLTHELLSGLLGWVHGFIEWLGWHHGQTYAAAAGIVLTFPCAYLTYRFIEVPGRHWLRRVFEERFPPSLGTEPSAP